MLLPTTSKRSRGVPNENQDFENRTIVSAGLKHSLHGIEYQTIILSQCFWRVVDKKVDDFLIATELPEAEKFDDVVVRYKKDGKVIARLLQVKHKQSSDHEEIKLNDLLTAKQTNKYSILKYFQSFQGIRSRYLCNSPTSGIFADCTIQDLVLLTNENIDDEVVAGCLEIDRENPLEDDILLKINDPNARKYRIRTTDNELTRRLELTLLMESDFRKLVNVLADGLLLNLRLSLQVRVCRDYLHPLMKHVLEFRRREMMLSKNFRKKHKKRPDEVNMLRTALIREIAFRKKVDFEIQISKSDRTDTTRTSDQRRKRKLPPPDCVQTSNLNELADRFEKALRPPGDANSCVLSEEFCVRNGIAREIVDCAKRTFRPKFINGEKTLTPQAQIFRAILIEKVIDDSVAEFEFQEVASRTFYTTKGFVTRFIPHSEPQIEEPIEFAKEIADLITKCGDDERNIEITEQSGSEKFIQNFCELAGHTIVKVSSWNEFSGNFLNGRVISEDMRKFRDSLKECLGEEEFHSLDTYKLHIDINFFDSCEEANFFKTLPTPPTDQSIIDFYDKFRLVVGYPNQMKTFELLKDELQITHRKLDQEAYLSLLVGGVRKWMADNIGTFYTPKKATAFLRELNEHLTCYEIDGVNQLKNAKLTMKYSFDCTHLKEYLIKFLLSAGTGVQIFGVENIKLNLSRILNTFYILRENYLTLEDPKRLESYLFTYGYIYLAFEDALNEAYRGTLSQKNQEPTKWSLRIIDCSNNDNLQSKPDNCKSVLRLMLEKPNGCKVSRKIIFVVNASVFDEFNSALVQYAQQEAQELIEIKSKLLETKFSELEYVAQKTFLENFKVTLQGRSVKLGDLISSDGVDLVDEDTLLELVADRNDEESEIRMGGGRQFALFTHNSHYVSRRIRPNFIDRSPFDIPTNIQGGVYYLKNGNQSDVIVIAETRHSFSTLKNQQLASFNGNVHWLQELQGELIWRYSIGSTRMLSSIPGPQKVSWSEKQFLEINDNKIILLYGIPGAGKSQLLASLSKQVGKDSRTIYTIRVNLSIYSDFFYKKQQEQRPLQALTFADCGEFLLEMLQSHENTRLKTQFEINVFRGSFNQQGSVKLQLVVFLDGFDEVCPAYKEIVLHYLQYLKDCPCLYKLFITTRPIFRADLETALNTLGYEIQDLSNEDQSKLFSHLVAEKGLEIEENEAKKFLKEARLKLSSKDEQFTAIPLHLKILADIYAEKSQERENQVGFKDCNKSEMFEMYVKQKYEIFLKDQMRYNQANATAREEAEGAYETFLSRHEKLALWALYNPEDLKQIIKSFEEYKTEVQRLLRKIEVGQYKFGIVFTVVDGKPQFSHRTFAEYFSARYIHRCMERSAKEGGMGILNIILNAENGPFLMFLDSMIPENRNWVCRDQRCSQITTRTISSTLLNLSQWSTWKVFDCISDILKEESILKRQVFIDIIERFPDDVNYFMLLGFLLKWGIDLTWTTPSGKTILHLLSSEAHPWKASSRQGKQSQFFYRLNQKYEIPLWLATSHRFDMTLFQPGFSTLDIFKMLVKKGAKCTADSDNLSPFHYAAASGNKEICEKSRPQGVVAEVNAKRDAYMQMFSEKTLFGKALRAEQEWKMWSKSEEQRKAFDKRRAVERELENLQM
ncbi:unnamed protein product [Hermetia illucens]|uniref:Nephrocystin 3-like N-terminal domain-containing protein n=1 Tax=Hermetia illucens TaxID=343691 RepID=A0A7R8YVS3_HERIL|nr:uncharacterized protein LOC119655432 [Hermetia illucens]CAD7086629.1 unnamed protein product [Hermetia illucens]